MADTNLAQGEPGAAERAKGQAREKGEELKQRAGEKAHELKSRATEQVEERKHIATDKLSSLSDALRAASERLGEREEPELARFGREAADYADRLAGYVRDNDANGMVRDLEEAARRNATMFVGGTFVAGLTLGRFLRASGDGARPEPTTERGAARGEPRGERVAPGETAGVSSDYVAHAGTERTPPSPVIGGVGARDAADLG